MSSDLKQKLIVFEDEDLDENCWEEIGSDEESADQNGENGNSMEQT